jgi:hypothetical protein
MADIPLLYGDIVFDAKPDAVPYNYRISYKVAQLCLTMRICGWGNVCSCSLIKLQMITFALLARNNMKQLIEFASDIGIAPIVRFDPAVNRALSFGIAYKFIEQQKNGNYTLTELGKKLADQIIYVEDLMISEISDLNELSKKLTEKKINELVEMWGDVHAEN